MKFSEPLTINSGVRIVWMLTATMFFGVGIGLIWWPSSQTIRAIRAQAKTLYDEGNQNESEIRRAAELRAVAKRVADDVRKLSRQESPSAVTAATLALLNRESRAHGVDVQSIAPAPASSPHSSDNALVGTAIEIDVRGQFRDVLAFISDLPRHNVLIDLSDASLVDSGVRSAKPVLDAKIHASIYRYLGIAERDKTNASGSL